MTEKQFITACKAAGVYWYKASLAEFRRGAQEIFYRASTPQGHTYGGYQKGTERFLRWTPEHGWEEIYSNLTAHRAAVYMKARREGRLQEIDPRVLENYLHNGFLTRRGLFARYSEERLQRMGKIARSHADYLGQETGDSRTDHDNRVNMRKDA